MEDEDLFAGRHVAEVAACGFLDRGGVLAKAPGLGLQPLILGAHAIEVVGEHRVFATRLHHRREAASAEERFDHEGQRREGKANLDQAADARRRRAGRRSRPGTAGARGASVVRRVGQRSLKIPKLATKYNP